MESPKWTLEDLKALLLLNRTPGIRMRALLAFFEGGQSPSEILDRAESGEKEAWRESLKATRKVFHPEQELEQIEIKGIQLLPWGAREYPPLLKETADPPFLLYVRGNLFESDQAAVAVVGSRHPSLYGQEQARRFGRRFAEWGLTVVSGFARGIDRASHEAALEISHGRTIAVLGSGLDVIYPKEHKNLYEEIMERGALVSEFALGAPPLAENFPKRNRIIAGLSLGVLVVEAHSRSGSLITAHLAADEGREVFALPGRVDQLGSRGVHRLIKEGAALVESPEEVFEILSPQLWPYTSRAELSGETAGKVSETKPIDLGEDEERMLTLFDAGLLTPDEAAGRGRLAISDAAALLTRLELRGLLRRRLDGRYERVRTRGDSPL